MSNVLNVMRNGGAGVPCRLFIALIVLGSVFLYAGASSADELKLKDLIEEA